VLAARLSALVHLFNKGKADLPDGTLHKDCVFRLNGRAYHDGLGRPASDPLVRLIGCGPAGYRLLVAALRYAIPDATVAIEEHLTERQTENGFALTARASLSGLPRDSAMPFGSECGLVLHGDPTGHIREIAVTMDDAAVGQIKAARAR
jgi:hypothetical protein